MSHRRVRIHHTDDRRTRGRLTAVTDTSLAVRVETESTTVPLRRVDRVDVSRGKDHVHSMAIGAIVGSVVGAVGGGVAGRHAIPYTSEARQLQVIVGAALGAIVGAGAGTAIGAWVAPERWETVFRRP